MFLWTTQSNIIWIVPGRFPQYTFFLHDFKQCFRVRKYEGIGLEEQLNLREKTWNPVG